MSAGSTLRRTSTLVSASLVLVIGSAGPRATAQRHAPAPSGLAASQHQGIGRREALVPRTAGQRAATAGRVRLRPIGAHTRDGRVGAVVVDEGALVHSAVLYPVDAHGQIRGVDAYAQATYVLNSLDTVLRAAGSGLDRIARLHVYVADAAVTASVDRLLSERFAAGSPPAVTMVESRMPRAGALVAMDVIAATARPTADGAPERLVVPGLPARPGDGAHVAVQPRGAFVIVSGRAAPGEFEPAVRATMEQLRGDLQGVGLDFDHVVQVKAFLGDMARTEQLQRIVARAFPGTAPPQVVTEWHDASLPVEIEIVATAPGASAGAERLTFVEPILSRYSRVARASAGRPIFVSGLTARSTEPAAQVRDVFDQLRRLLTEAGSDMRHIAKATYYVSDKAVDQEINTIRPSVYEATRPPAASKISVRGTGSPGQGTVIDAIALTIER